jgi:hypothetical protein
MTQRIYLIEFQDTAVSPAVPTTYRFGSAGYNTRPTDTPPNTHYSARVIQPCLVRRDLFAGGAAFGSTKVGYGEVTLANSDGALDYMLEKSFGEQPVVVKLGNDTAAYSTFVTVLTASVEQVEVTSSKVTLRIKDKQALLDKPLQTLTYAGDNVLPAGAEGTANDIKGQRKPLLYGSVLNIHPPLVNTSKLMFQLNSGFAAPSAVYVKGVVQAFHVDYATQALLEAASIPSGHYSTCTSAGLFRLGSNHEGDATADAATADSHALADLMAQIATDAGVTMSATDVAALKALNPATGGVWFQDSSTETDQGTTGLQVLDQVAQSLGAWYGFDQAGVLRTGRVGPPTGTPVATLDASNVIELEKTLGSDDLNGLPVWRVNLRYRKNYKVQSDSDLAGSVAVARRAELAQEYRTVAAEDPDIKLQFLNAKELTRETLMLSESDAQAEATRLLDLFKVRRDSYSATVRWTDELANSLDIGNVINLKFPRFGLTAGKLFVINGLTLDLQRRRAELSLWG